MFTLFGKLDATAKINTSGIGLGLSICKAVADALNGNLFLASSYYHNPNESNFPPEIHFINKQALAEKKSGSTFVFVTPLNPSDVLNYEQEKKRQEEDSRKKKEVGF